jgi:hypothetical protein
VRSLRRIVAGAVACGVLCLPIVNGANARAQASGGNRDFDFAFGTWATHIAVLDRGRNGKASWTQMDGTVVTRTVWNGRANLEEIEANAPSGRFEGMTLRLYDAQAGEWNLYWSHSEDGDMGPPTIGSFRGGSGVFYDQEPLAGKAVFIRQRYYDVTATSYRFEQAVSSDGGAHWQPNFRAALTRRTEPSVTPEPVAALPRAQHDFDWQFGDWNARMSRLDRPLTASTSWTKLQARVLVRKVWGGRANLAEISVDGGSQRLEFLALRLFEPQRGQWSLNFAGVKDGKFGIPLYGTFANGRGDFYDQEAYNGKTIWIRFSFYDIGSTSARDEQAFSNDGGKTWEVNWISLHSRPLTAAQ